MANINYDDFINNIHPDPAHPTATIMLSGFVGRAADGHVRIYPDASLGTWYDVPEGDVVHSSAIPDSKLGGSYLWVKSSAQIKPGSASAAAQGAAAQGEAAQGGAAQGGAAPAAAPAAGPTPATHCFVCWPPTSPLAGCDQAAQAQAAAAAWPTPATHCFVCDPRQAAAAVQPTPALTIAAVCSLPAHCAPTPATHCFICPPITPVCTPPAVCQPTPATHCFICPPHQTPQCTLPAVCQPTPATHCFICPPHQTPQCTLPAVCQPTPATHCFICPPITQPVACGVLPPSVGCPQGGQPQGAQAAAMQPTPATHCFICPPHQTPGCTPHQCVPAAALPQTFALCTQGFPTFCGCTPGIDCAGPGPGGLQTNPMVCTQGLATFCGCTPGLDCAPGARAAAHPETHPANCPTRFWTCVAEAFQPTPTVMTRCIHCPPHVTPLCTLATVCTFPGLCPPGRTGVFNPFGG